ncbi:AI-2E family transporter [Hydromonas duriensis]|uniref:Putative PurR-regulated permease PerM n=1 Tax=Hydromonas duriensis TaxID=1527608 RepID=A0A4R6YB65_9BURK|nr:AI-2E family transporter [Hydromonas duriensis]TDR32765.1 putative PurR-regulated permease PerM [Hydromonas duriensis]
MKWTQIVKAALALAVIVAFFWLVWTIKSILIPFGFAALLAYLLNPIVKKLGVHGVSRSLAAGLASLSFLLLFFLVAFIPWPILSQQLIVLQARLPLMLDNLQHTITSSSVLLTVKNVVPSFGDGDIAAWFEHISQFVVDNVNFSNISHQVFGVLMKGGSVILNILTWVALLPLITYYLLANWPSTVKMWRRLIPVRWRAEVFLLGDEMDAVLSQYVRGQFLLIVSLAAYYAIALSLTGLDVAVSVGILTGCFVIVPYIGFSLGLLLGALSAMLQFGFNTPFFAVLAIYGVGQVLESYVLTPRLVGERIGLSPVAVIFALMVFGALFGFVGIIFALPASAVIVVLMRQMRRKYLESSFYNEGKVSP